MGHLGVRRTHLLDIIYQRGFRNLSQNPALCPFLVLSLLGVKLDDQCSLMSAQTDRRTLRLTLVRTFHLASINFQPLVFHAALSQLQSAFHRLLFAFTNEVNNVIRLT